MSAVHCTQRFVVVLQTVPVMDPAHSAFIVHEMTQRFVVVSQAIPASPQLASLRHCTQAPALEQYRPPVQSAEVAHATQE